MQMIAGVMLSLLKGYLIKLAGKDFLHWALFEIADAVVQSTETKEDDRWLAKIKETVED